MSDMNALVLVEVEKRLSDPAYLREAVLHLTDIIADNKKVIQSLEHEVRSLEPAKNFYTAVAESDDWMDFKTASKLLAISGLGPNNLIHFLDGKDILYRNNGNYPNKVWYEPYQRYVERGYFKIVEKPFDLPNGDHAVSKKTVVSQKGLDFIRKLVTEASA